MEHSSPKTTLTRPNGQIAVDANAELAKHRHEYKAKPNPGGEVIPDSFSLTSGWKCEKDGLATWPSVYITNIAEYLNGMTSSVIVNRKEKDTGIFKKVHMHDIIETSDKCIIKAKVTPSMAINQQAYDTWIVVEKDRPAGVGGRVLLCSCNHVAVVLFRVEDAVKRGIAKKSKTNVLATRNVPRTKRVMRPFKAVEMSCMKSSYGKERCQEDESILKEDASESCFEQLQEQKRHVTPKVIFPKSVVDVTLSEMEKPHHSIESVAKALSMTHEESDNICKQTVEQASSKELHHQRRGRITASLFHRVASRAKSIQKDEDANVTSLTDTLLGKKAFNPSLAMKHGTSLEPIAKKKYTLTMKKHRHIKASEIGLTVSMKHPYLAASPDLVVQCECCGKGLCEIKCPETVKDQILTEDNIKYLLEENGKIVFDTKHPYYFQRQGQMGILSRSFCDLFIYTLHGSLTVRAICGMNRNDQPSNRDENQAPLLITTGSDPNNNAIPGAAEQNVERPGISAPRALIPISTQPMKRKRKPEKGESKTPVFLCGICGLDCLDEPQSENEQSVQGYGCSVWTHYVCAGVTDELVSIALKWFCKKCKN
ncbi:hypothetical protein MAR_035704 [Mya arenaria]|uniref:Zinc finger PHD-type domain-containing protein n=1 Tax=Mya arenaria TaxID=6604 RepID=A0ABY7EPY3_MYAAR|nr:hypothetical protein MAR_035704 [Mya arenaria]